MPAHLVLGPLLRYVGVHDATVWVETDAPATVSVCGFETRTFEIAGHHYAIVCVEGLGEDTSTAYEVLLDGECVWPEEGDARPPSRIRTLGRDEELFVSFGSCRVGVPHYAPYTSSCDDHADGFGPDALQAMALRLQTGGEDADWPHLLVLLGDQIYADELSPDVRDLVRARRAQGVKGPTDQVGDFEEYTHLYLDAWTAPEVRWLLANVPAAMIFDDHDVNDDWNISASWVEDMRTTDWWEKRIVSGFMSYWLYQHLGNLSPAEIKADRLLAELQAADGDGCAILRAFAHRADREVLSARWSYHRDLGRTRMLMMDSRAARILEPGKRQMIDSAEWAWIEQHAQDDIDHLLLGTSLPVFLGPAMHASEAWNEAVCAGGWGKSAAKLGEKLRRALDMEHWAAFSDSFAKIVELLQRVAGREGGPASIVLLSGDVHHAYLARIHTGEGHAPVWQAVCSPMRNPLDRRERFVLRRGFSPMLGRFWGVLGRTAGAPAPAVEWDFEPGGPWFDNQVATLHVAGRSIHLSIERATGDPDAPVLEPVLRRQLA